MADFKYRAADENSKVSEGTITANTKSAALKMLASMKLTPITIKILSDSEEQSTKDQSQALKKIGGENTALALFKKLKQLCSTGGMPVSDALKALSLRSFDPKVKAVSKELYKDLSEGKTLAAALQRYPDTFDLSMTHLVEAGESTANLTFVFDNIIRYIEERKDLKKTITSALAYPIFLCIIAISVVMLFLFFMLPKIKSMMSNLGAGENNAIIMMNYIGDSITMGFPVVLVIVVIVAMIIYFYRKTEEGVKTTDSYLLSLPTIGKIAFDSDICKFANLASTLFSSGVNTTETFRLSEKIFKNTELRSRFRQFRTSVNDGAPISAALQRYGLLENEDIDVISVGERTGSLVSSFEELGRSHNESLKRRIKIATAALGGGALGFAFLLVFVFAAGIVLSILGLSQGMMGQ